MNPMSRRNALITAGAVAATGVLVACSDSDGDDAAMVPNDTTKSPTTKVLAKVSDVPVGSVFQYSNPVDGTPGYLFQPAAGTFIAYSAVCSHQGCIVNFAKEQNMFQCPCHGATYDGTTGEVTGGPAPLPLDKPAIKVVGDNIELA